MKASNTIFSDISVTFWVSKLLGWDDVDVFPESVYIEHDCDHRNPYDVNGRVFYDRASVRYVPERTCEWVWGEEWLESTPESPRELQWANWYPNCGCWDGCEDELCDFDDPGEKPTEWSFCPRCGAKVVQDER